MPFCVLDCSATISWLMPDESSGFYLLDKIAEEGAGVPSLWTLEIGNILLIAERKKRITREQRQKAIHILKQLPITIDAMTTHHAWLETMELAEKYNLPLYDATYLELSIRRSLPLATFDKLLKAAAKLANTSLEI